MSNSNHIGNRPRPLVTGAIVAGALILGIPVAAAAILYSRADMPSITLGSKEIKAGLNGATKTVTYSLLSGPQDATITAGYISIICSLLFCIGAVIVRHVSQHNIFGWAMVFPAFSSFAANVGIVAYVMIESGKNKEADDQSAVRYEDGKYNTDGKVFTQEAWACMMDKWYEEREGHWAEKACKNLVSDFYLPSASGTFVNRLWQ
jgi:hypothetical protein